MKKTIILLTLIFSASLANAHSLWINSFESPAHGGYNAMVCLGWGHALPMDDILNSTFSKAKKGKAQFRAQSAGQWMISVSHKEDVTPDGPLKDLYGKENVVSQAATLTFNVQ